MSAIRVLVADDHALVRMGIVALLGTEDDITVVGEAETGKAAVQQAIALRPDVVIMDLMMPDMDGLAATLELRRCAPNVKVLVLTTTTVADDIVRVIHAGGRGAIAKSSDNSLLIDAIRKVAGGGRIVAPEIEKLLADNPPAPKLTRKQSEILEAVTRGLTNADIAKMFGIGAESVKDHLNVIFSKLGAANRAEAVTVAFRRHLLKV
ncbi:MAG: response regulator transcription factor [Kiritimatiellae bacterium]|nr:response regulator transcription factor [Kiritimatiellia bacterium]